MATGLRMLRVVITQRVDVKPETQERRDALDQAWWDQLESILKQKLNLFPVPNQQATEEWLEHVAPHLIVLSGGNDIGEAADRDALETRILQYAVRKAIPVLGVCRGMQMLNVFLGGSLSKLSNHVAVMHSVFNHEAESSLKAMTVNSFHNYGITTADLSTKLEPLFLHSDGSIEAARHRQFNWLGIMWHPERDGNDQIAMDWLSDYLNTLL